MALSRHNIGWLRFPRLETTFVVVITLDLSSKTRLGLRIPFEDVHELWIHRNFIIYIQLSWNFFLNLSSPLNFNIEPTRSFHPPIVSEYIYTWFTFTFRFRKFNLNLLQFLEKRISNKFLIINEERSRKNVEWSECEILFAFLVESAFPFNSVSMRKTKRREDKFQSQTRLPKIRLNFTDPDIKELLLKDAGWR